MSKGKVTEQEMFIMKGMYSEGMSVEDISKELSRTKATVEKYLDLEDEPEPEPKKKKNKTNFLKNTVQKNNRGVTVMTGAESSRAEMSKHKKQDKIITKFKHTIHKISDD